ncbi:MAG: hypothetical protein HQL44_08820 [Alphaproteobacteria bacterium]|nr:hypothetical protein [Alphaproteobacteria bacterium]
MKPIYHNFDALDVAFQGALPQSVLTVLEKAKAEAQEQQQSAYCILGPGRVHGHVKKTGLSGGYAFIFNRGPMEEIWFIMNNTKSDRWNLRATVRSASLALRGYQGAKEELLTTLDRLGVIGPHGGTPVERISRIDYCVDFATEDGFIPDAENIVAHSNSTAAVHYAQEIDLAENRRGRRLETIRVGKMPNRQVTIYDKTREIHRAEHHLMWFLWGLSREEFTGDVWRVEARAGKDELNKWNLRSFADLESKAGDVFVGVMEAIRYMNPKSADNNTARWDVAPFWRQAQDVMREALAPYTSNVLRSQVKEVFRQALVKQLRQQIVGLATSYAVARGLDISEIPGIVAQIECDMMNEAVQDPAKLQARYERAMNRYIFLDEGGDHA